MAGSLCRWQQHSCLSIVGSREGVGAIKVEQVGNTAEDALLDGAAAPEAEVVQPRGHQHRCSAAVDAALKRCLYDVPCASAQRCHRRRIPACPMQIMSSLESSLQRKTLPEAVLPLSDSVSDGAVMGMVAKQNPYLHDANKYGQYGPHQIMVRIVSRKVHSGANSSVAVICMPTQRDDSFRQRIPRDNANC